MTKAASPLNHGFLAKSPEIRVPAPGSSLLAWLCELTPLLAPVMRTNEIALPVTKPLVPPAAQTDERALRYWDDLRTGYHDALRASGLTRMIVNNRRARDYLLGQLLAPPVHSVTGVPLHVPDTSSNPPLMFMGRRNLSKPMRMLTAAVAHDLGGKDLQTTSKFLGHLDHGWRTSKGEWIDFGGQCTGAQRDLVAARRALAVLGVWPFTHAEDGQLPRGWWTQSAFTGALSRWYDCASSQALLYGEISHRAAAK